MEGGYVTIAIVFEHNKRKDFKKHLKSLIHYLLKETGQLKSLKVSKDMDGNEWIEVKGEKLLEKPCLYEMLEKYFYGEIHLGSDVFSKAVLNLLITIENNEEYFVFYINIPSQQYLDFGNVENLEALTADMIRKFKELFILLNFDYIVCDHEADVIYSPVEFKKTKKVIYAISMIPNNNGMKTDFEIILGDWYLDGFTEKK